MSLEKWGWLHINEVPAPNCRQETKNLTLFGKMSIERTVDLPVATFDDLSPKQTLISSSNNRNSDLFWHDSLQHEKKPTTSKNQDMFILSELAKLPMGPDLPVPWYLRSVLGFLTNTSCHVTFVEPDQGKGRPVPDIVVSVLDPVDWDTMLRVDCSRSDAPGVIEEAFEAAGDANIALAESITTDEGSKHAVTMICEIRGNGKATASRIKKRLKSNGFTDITIHIFQPRKNVVWADVGIVRHGWVCRTKWREEFTRRYGATAEAHNIDLSKVVATVDTATRGLRYVFPHKGARNIHIEHAVKPGALKTLTRALAGADFNLLSAILRRGGAKPGNNVLVATAEPKAGLGTGDPSSRLREQIQRIPVKYRPIPKIHEGVEASTLIWSKDPEVLVAPCPSSLWHRVLSEKRHLPTGKVPIFLSRRFTDYNRAEMIARCIRDVAVKHGCVLLESNPEQGKAPVIIFEEVAAKMWLAEAGIVLVIDSQDKNYDALGPNLPHECGFLQGQAKPTLLLVEGRSSDALQRWSNICGIHAPRFAPEMETFDLNHPNSVSKVVEEWIASFRECRLSN